MAQVSRPAAPACIVALTYVRSLEEVDAQMTAHVAFLLKGVEDGILLMCGRQVPRVGGIFVCRGHRAEVEAFAATDPFVTSGVATTVVTELTVSFAAAEIAPLLA